MEKMDIKDYHEQLAQLRMGLDWMIRAGIAGGRRASCLIVGLRPMHTYDMDTTGTVPVVSGTVAKADECPHMLQEQTAVVLEARVEELIKAGFKRMLDQAVEIGEEAGVDAEAVKADLAPFMRMLGDYDDVSSIIYCHNDGGQPTPCRLKGAMVPRCSVCGMAEYSDGFKASHKSMVSP